jgi:hypothetical protein
MPCSFEKLGDQFMNNMHTPTLPAVVLASLALSLNGCVVVGGIFKAGVWVGVLAVALVIGLIFGALRMMGGSR